MSFYILSIPSIILFYVAFFNICKYKFTTAEIIIAPIVTYVVLLPILFLSTLNPPFFDVDIFGNLTIVGSLTLLAYKKIKNWLLSGYYAIFVAVTVMISGSAVSVFIDVIFKISIYENRHDLLVYFINLVLNFPACYFISRYLGKHMHQQYIRLSSEVRHKFALYGFSLSALTYALSHINLFAYQLSEERALLSSINLIIIIIIFYVSILMIAAYSLSQQKQMESELKSKAQEDLESYTRKLEDAYDDMRRFRHDHLNMLYGLTGYVDNNNQAGFKEYLEENLTNAKEALDTLDKAMDHLKFVHIPELKGLLSIKLAQAQARGIELKLDIAKPIGEMPIERSELCRMVGIMLDNAVEELESHDYTNKVLSFGIVIDGNDILIICANTCRNPPPIEQIFSKGYTTKGFGRGLGLCNLKQTAIKCGNVLFSAQEENNLFTIVLTIRNPERQV